MQLEVQKMNDQSKKGPYKKLKKRSFGQRLKRMRQDQHDELPQDEYDYLIRVMQRWKEPFEEDDDKRIFVANVFKQMEGKERQLAGHKLASRVIELLLPHALPTVVEIFCKGLTEDLRIVCTDPFASFVLEKLLIMACFRDNVDKSEELLKWVQKVCKYLCNNFDGFSDNRFASHVLTTGIQCVTGIRIVKKGDANFKDGSKNKFNAQSRSDSNKTEGYESMTSYQFSGDPVLSDCIDILQEKILQLEASQIRIDAVSLAVQSALECFSKTSEEVRTKTVVKSLQKSFFRNVDHFLDCQPMVRLLETMIGCAVPFPHLSTQIHHDIFTGNWLKLSKHNQGNFLVQSFLKNNTCENAFDGCWTELSPNLEELLSDGHVGGSGVLLALVKASRQFNIKQTAVMDQLITLFKCGGENAEANKDETFVLCCIKLTSADKLQDDLPILLHGSLILQELLMFKKPIKVVRSLLSMSPATLQKIFCGHRGSYILDVFCTSQTVGEKSRDSMAAKLSSELVSLACDKCGCRALETLWKQVSIKTKQAIVEQLAKQDKKLQSDKFGRHIHRLFGLSVWIHKNDEWSKVITKEGKNKELFEDIVGPIKDAPVDSEKPATEKKKEKKRKLDTNVKDEPTSGEELKSLKVEDSETPTKKKKKEQKMDSESSEQNNSSEPKQKIESAKKQKKQKKNKSYLDDL